MLTVDVPLNTMLADLDETLRRLLRDGARTPWIRRRRHRLRRARARVVRAALQADGERLPLRPARVGDAAHQRVVADDKRTGARSRAARRWSWSARTPSRRGRRPSRTSTACSRRCSRSSTRIRSSRRHALNGRLANGSQACPIKARIGQGKGEKSDFWSAIGGQYKVSLDYVVRLSVDSGAKLERGPEVRTQTVRTRLVRRPGARDRRDAPLGRPRQRQEGRAARQRLGHAPGRRDAGPRAPPTAASASTACRPAATGCWRARRTAARPTRSLKSPAPGSTW